MRAWTSHSRPKMPMCASTMNSTIAPTAAITAPGKMNRWLGECTSRKRRCRQPSRKLDSLDSPPRGWYSMANWRSVRCLLGRADHHLGGELHAGRAQIQLGQDVAAEGAHAAVRVIDAGAEQQVEEPRQQRVADVAVQPWHGARLDVLHPVADDHVGAVLELGDEARDLVEVVRQVGVGHHDVLGRVRRRSRPGRRFRSRAWARGRRSRRRLPPVGRCRPRNRCRRRSPRR